MNKNQSYANPKKLEKGFVKQRGIKKFDLIKKYLASLLPNLLVMAMI